MANGLYNRIRHAIRYWLLRRLPTCQALAPVMSESLDRSLSLRERVLVRLHLLTCIWCVWYLDQLRTLRTELDGRADAPSDEVALSADARDRIRRALDEAQR